MKEDYHFKLTNNGYELLQNTYITNSDYAGLRWNKGSISQEEFTNILKYRMAGIACFESELEKKVKNFD